MNSQGTTLSPGKSPEQAAQRLTGRILGLALAAAAAAVWAHAPCLQGGFLANMDDHVYLAAARQHNGLTIAGVRWAFTETRPYYQLLPRLMHLAAYSVWDAHPAGHHAVNLALHAGNAALVTLLAWTLLALGLSPPVGGSAPPHDPDREPTSHPDAAGNKGDLWTQTVSAGFVGLVFAVHPLQAESVAWISGRTQLLCTALMLGCVLAYLRTATTGRRVWRWTSGALFVMAWLSKPIVVTLPVVLLLLDWCPLRRFVTPGWRTLVREKLWMFAVSIVLTLLTARFAWSDEMLHNIASLGLTQRLLLAERAIVFYLWKLVWPSWLSPFYPLVGSISITVAEFWVPAVVLTAVLIGVWLARRRWPSLVAAGAGFLALLLPMSGLTQYGIQSVANRHMYVAMVPVLLVAAGAGAWLWRRAPPAGRAALVAAGAVALVCLGARTRVDVRMWHDDETLARSILRWYPGVALANRNVAEAAIARRDFATALPYAERARECDPNDRYVQELLGLAYLKTHRYDAAVRTLEPLTNGAVWLPAARYNLACAYARLGSNDVAVGILRELLAREPRFAELARRDTEFHGLRGDPRFTDIVGGTAP